MLVQAKTCDVREIIGGLPLTCRQAVRETAIAGLLCRMNGIHDLSAPMSSQWAGHSNQIVSKGLYALLTRLAPITGIQHARLSVELGFLLLDHCTQ